MPKARDPRVKSPQSLKAPPGPSASRRTAKRACSLIERMLIEMELGLGDREYRMSDEWERLFGTKESMVVNLQKLVAALAAVPSYTAVKKAAVVARDAPITDAELAMLKTWINEGNAEETRGLR